MCGHPIKKEKKKKSIYIERERERELGSSYTLCKSK